MEAGGHGGGASGPEQRTPPPVTRHEQEVNLNQMKGDVTSCPSEAAPHVTMETGQSNEPEMPQNLENTVVVPGNANQASEKLRRVHRWSVTTYKVGRQVLAERLGRGSRTVDLDLEPRLELLKDGRQRYAHVSKLAQTLADQLAQFTVTQKTLGGVFAELSVRTPTLHVEFAVNADAQKFLSKSGETLTVAMNSFSSAMNTFITKTTEDTMLNAKLYEAVRLEYDAHRVHLEELNLGGRDASKLPKLDQAQQDFQNQRERYQKVRDDLSVKLKLLQDNKVKVLQQQLWLVHGAVAAHTLSCHSFLQQSVQLLIASAEDAPSWLEED